MPASVARKKLRSSRVALNQKRGRRSMAPCVASVVVGARRVVSTPGSSRLLAAIRTIAPHARGRERIRAVEKDLHLGLSALDVAPELGRDHEQHQRIALMKPRAALLVARRTARLEEAAGRLHLRDEAARECGLAAVEHRPRNVVGIVREREAEEQQHHDRLHDHHPEEGLVVAHHRRFAIGEREHVREEAAARTCGGRFVRAFRSKLAGGAHARLPRERTAMATSTPPKRSSAESSGRSSRKVSPRR